MSAHHFPQLRIPATLMRGGTSKGLFLRLQDLPLAAQTPGPARDRLLQRLMGSPDPYANQIDGLGAATSSSSKCVILAPSSRPGHDVDYLYGQVAIDRDLVDWSGNCGNLSAAAAAFALHAGLLDASRVPERGLCSVRLWQANIGKTILAQVPVRDGRVLEGGDFRLDGVAFPAAEIVLDFLDPAEGEGALFPTGRPLDELALPDGRLVPATLISAGIPTVFVRAADVGCSGTELREALNGDAAALARFEALRVAGALRMGLISRPEQAAERQHTPKIAFVAPPQDYRAADGRWVRAGEIDLLVRAFSMGRLHHAMMGTASVAIAAAAAVPGTLVHEAAGGLARESLCFGHPSGSLRVGAQAQALPDGGWRIASARMSRSARILMEGWARVPTDCF